MLRLILISTAIFFSQGLLAQFVLSGVVKDEDNTPIKKVIVKVNDEIKISTDDVGYFEIEVQKGNQKVAFAHPEYLDTDRMVMVDKNTELDVQLTPKFFVMEEVTVLAIREKETSPMSYSTLDKEALNERNLGQDLPVLLNFLPSVVTTSDAGAGVGYTGMRVRGSDASRTNVTINGVPYNDSESQLTYWVNLPDFVSSVDNVQLVRGVGSSTNGSGAFGANLSLLTNGLSNKPSIEIAGSAGSFNTRKASLKFDTGMLNDHFNFIGRLSRIYSDGYVDRASSDLSSYFTQLSYNNKNTLIKLLVFGGLEETYHAWDGIDPDKLMEDRTYNYAGLYYDENGEEQFYDNQVDHYNQDHYQLIVNQKLNNHFNLNLTGHYTWGRGYYEQFKEDESLADYNIENQIIGMDTISVSDIVRRKWLDNDFYGVISSVAYASDNLESTMGLSFNQYRGDHFGEVVWARFASNSQPRDRYYEDFGNKDEFNVFWKNTYSLTNNLQLFADLQFRSLNYRADGVAEEVVDDTFNFFNPKLGVSYQLNDGLLYGSVAMANKEPSRGDYENGNPKHEELIDYEMGYRLNKGKSSFNFNGYYMFYNNQLVLTGELGENDAPIRTNVGKSYRMGLEIDAKISVNDNLIIRPNVTLSKNENIDFFVESEAGITDLGRTKIGYSPEIIAGNSISYKPVNNLWVSLLSKYVGEQFMGNTEAPLSVLESYFVNDVSINYTINTERYIKAIEFSLLLNNVLDQKYVSNGWWVPGYVGYYPQAGFNFLTGVKVKF